MIRQILARYYRWKALKYGTGRKQFLRYSVPTGREWAEYLRRHGGLAGVGVNCTIQTNCYISDPAHVRIGNNVFLTKCDILGHDGCIDMLNKAFGIKLDSVGKVDIKDNVFVGHRALILPDVTIGPNAIVAAGSVVTRDVPANTIVAGVPARAIGSVDALVSKLQQKTKQYPWYSIIEQRNGSFDPVLEPMLQRMRTEYFWPDLEQS